MSTTVKSSAKKRVSESEASKPEKLKRDAIEDDFDAALSDDIKGIVSTLQLIREKAQKDGQKKNEETISRVRGQMICFVMTFLESHLLEFVKQALNSYCFSGNIPPTIGYLSNLSWLDLADNELVGPIPVSNGTTLGLDMLVNTKHFHFGKNKLSGEIPSQLFSSNMSLIHLLLDSNQLRGNISPSLGYVQNLTALYLSNNQFTGPLPNLTGYGQSQLHFY